MDKALFGSIMGKNIYLARPFKVFSGHRFGVGKNRFRKRKFTTKYSTYQYENALANDQVVEFEGKLIMNEFTYKRLKDKAAHLIEGTIPETTFPDYRSMFMPEMPMPAPNINRWATVNMYQCFAPNGASIITSGIS